jgi:uncharacterized protein (TIGR03546 family)
MITRKLGKILRGTATPFQLFSASLLACVLAFMPGLTQAPGLITVFTLLLIILNANLALAGLVLIGFKILSLLIAPVTFAVGEILLDGPTQGFFQGMINAPGLALFGFDYYLTTGGLAMGLVLGTITGIAMVKGVTGFRKKMVALEAGSERFTKYNSKSWVKLLKFVFVGGGPGKKSYEDLLSTKMGNPIRILGAVFAGLVVVMAIIIQMFASGPIVTIALQKSMEKANGATVDLSDAELDLDENRLVLNGLAMSDPNNLDLDLFRAARVEADVSGMSLLKKRLQLDRVTISDASTGEKRVIPGKRIGKAPTPTPAPTTDDPNTKSIDDYINDAKLWKERLAQAKRWLEKLSGSDQGAPGEEGTTEETLEERLAREIEQYGYAWVRASHLIEGAPTLTITELIAEKVRAEQFLPGETMNITATNLSTHPRLLGRTPQVVITSSKDTLGAKLRLTSFESSVSSNQFAFHFRGLPTDKIASSLKVAGDTPLLQGGTLDIQTDGQWTSKGGIQVDLPLNIQLHNTTLNLPGTGPTPVDEFSLPIGVRGALDNPRISLDDKQLADALIQAGVSKAKQELTNKAQEEINKQLGDKVGEESKGLLKGLFGGDKKK